MLCRFAVASGTRGFAQDAAYTPEPSSYAQPADIPRNLQFFKRDR